MATMKALLASALLGVVTAQQVPEGPFVHEACGDWRYADGSLITGLDLIQVGFRNHTDESQLLASPTEHRHLDFTGGYDAGARCEWNIRCEGGQVAVLRLTALNTESSYDHVSLFDGTSASAATIAQLSGSAVPATQFGARGGEMLVVFTADRSVQSHGFAAEYWCAAPESLVLNCTDPAALNFSPVATADDGSCVAAVRVYMGCFADPNDSRDMQNGTDALLNFHTTEQVADECATLCNGFRYMGLQWTSECWCANHYGSQGPSVACGENEGELCGNGEEDCSLANAVWDLTPQVAMPERPACTLPARSYPFSGVNSIGYRCEVPGCMNPAALNYLLAATVDDGSCVADLAVAPQTLMLTGRLRTPNEEYYFRLQPDLMNNRPHYATPDGSMYLYWSAPSLTGRNDAGRRASARAGKASSACIGHKNLRGSRPRGLSRRIRAATADTFHRHPSDHPT